MKSFFERILTFVPALVFTFAAVPGAHAQWMQPTPEELSMTAQPEVPGAAAVYLFREEITDDKLHSWSKYVRIKVLTEKGKDLANVELRQFDDTEGGGYTVADIQGRTIHPDGTVIPFSGKPYQKLIEKGQGYREQAKVFTLPDVEVGSIIEYRYNLRYDDNLYFAPSWFVQTDLYTRKAHYLWRPTSRELVSKNERGEQLTSSVSWTPILPKGFEVKQTAIGGTSSTDPRITLELNVHDIMPIPDEEYMPPVKSFSYRVLFYYSPYRNADDYWKNEGRSWGKIRDKFIGPGPKVRQAVQQLITPADTTDEARLRKIYAEVMKLENTRFTRTRSTSEVKAEGMNPPKNTDDVWEAKRGTDDQLTELFVAMARAAGMKAYLMTVTSREHNVFFASFTSFDQLDDYIAIVAVNGKEQFFDPGQRYCPYGHLAWQHTFASGLRQSENGTVFASAPAEPYSASRTQRIADLTMDEHGEVTGIIKFTWTGAPALNWRHIAIEGDNTSLKDDLKRSIEGLLPGGMDLKVASIENLDSYEQPLTVSFTVKGPIGSPTGKRLLIPADLFVSNEKPKFPHEKRELGIYFDYTYITQDVVRVTFPRNFSIESVPNSETVPLEKYAAAQYKTDSTSNSVTMRRDVILGELYFKQEEYPQLRGFYSKMETKDQEPAVLKLMPPSAPAGN